MLCVYKKKLTGGLAPGKRFRFRLKFVYSQISEHALNSRLYIIRRLRNHLSMKSVLKVVDGIFNSKIRYGLQLYGKVRLENADPTCESLKRIQIIQNDMLRVLNGTRVSEKISISSMLKKFGALSVNQLDAQIKLLEIWKSQKCSRLSAKDPEASTGYNKSLHQGWSKWKAIWNWRKRVNKKNLYQWCGESLE